MLESSVRMPVAVVQRAPRVAMEAAMLIRRAGESSWRRATSINISRTGVLLQTDGVLLQPETRVEVVVTLPVFGDLAARRILGVGRIVRVQEVAGRRDPVVAAHLEDCRILPDEGDRSYPAPAR